MIQLNTGAKMPVVGLGTWKAKEGQAAAAVAHALKVGYRHIDCAAIYLNEAEIGGVFHDSFSRGTMQREDVFVTSKLWNTEHEPKDVVKACKHSLKDLQLDYLDLYLMHWGVATPPEYHEPLNARGEPTDADGALKLDRVPTRATWEAMEALVKDGLVRAIGVSNFTAPMLIDLSSYATIMPAMNQIELHPYLQQSRLVEFCQSRGIVVTAYSPLGSSGNVRSRGSGESILIEDPVIAELAARYNKNSAQILIRWAIQHGTVAIPKSVTPERIASNFGVFNFELSPQDMDAIKKLDRHHRYIDPYEWWKIPYFD